jgi:transposase
MLKVKFTESDRLVFQYERYHHPHAHVQKKMEVLHLKSLDISLSNELICKISGVSPNTMRSYLKEYNEGGIEKLKELRLNPLKSEMQAYSDTIKSYMKENPPSSISQARAMIEQIRGIKRGLTQTRSFLKSLGFRFLQVGTIPFKATDELKKTNGIANLG